MQTKSKRWSYGITALWKMGLGHTQSRSPIYLFAIAHINWELVAVDLPPFFRKNTLKNGVRAYTKKELGLPSSHRIYI